MLWLIYHYGIITLVFSQILESAFPINLSCSPFKMKPTRCTLLLSIFISTSVHVSGNYVPIIRRTYCIYATLVFFTLYGWLSGLLVGMRLGDCLVYWLGWDSVSSQPSSTELTVSMRHWYFSLCTGGCLVCWPVDQTHTHTERKIPVSHRCSKFSWWWAHSCPKHVEKLK